MSNFVRGDKIRLPLEGAETFVVYKVVDDGIIVLSASLKKHKFSMDEAELFGQVKPEEASIVVEVDKDRIREILNSYLAEQDISPESVALATGKPVEKNYDKSAFQSVASLFVRTKPSPENKTVLEDLFPDSVIPKLRSSEPTTIGDVYLVQDGFRPYYAITVSSIRGETVCFEDDSIEANLFDFINNPRICFIKASDRRAPSSWGYNGVFEPQYSDDKEEKCETRFVVDDVVTASVENEVLGNLVVVSNTKGDDLIHVEDA